MKVDSPSFMLLSSIFTVVFFLHSEFYDFKL